MDCVINFKDIAKKTCQTCKYDGHSAENVPCKECYENSSKWELHPNIISVEEFHSQAQRIEQLEFEMQELKSITYIIKDTLNRLNYKGHDI